MKKKGKTDRKKIKQIKKAFLAFSKKIKKIHKKANQLKKNKFKKK